MITAKELRDLASTANSIKTELYDIENQLKAHAACGWLTPYRLVMLSPRDGGRKADAIMAALKSAGFYVQPLHADPGYVEWEISLEGKR